MFLFKACPRCGGDLELTTGIDGPYHRCIQCGYTAYVKRGQQPEKEVSRPLSEAVSRR